jgi:hypothetical protein
VVALTAFAPLAQAKLTNGHACCVKQRHAQTPAATSSASASQHDCCTLAPVTPAAPTTTTKFPARPLPAHPFVEEFYPASESSDSISQTAERAPRAASSDR